MEGSSHREQYLIKLTSMINFITNAFNEMEERRKMFENSDLVWIDYEKIKKSQIPSNFGLDVITNFLTQTYIKAYQGAEAIDIGKQLG